MSGCGLPLTSHVKRAMSNKPTNIEIGYTINTGGKSSSAPVVEEGGGEEGRGRREGRRWEEEGRGRGEGGGGVEREGEGRDKSEIEGRNREREREGERGRRVMPLCAQGRL